MLCFVLSTFKSDYFDVVLLQTTLAKIIANGCKTKGKYKFCTMSATSAGVNEVKEAVKIAKNDQKSLGRRTILFLDEIHRFNKLQQVLYCKQ